LHTNDETRTAGNRTATPGTPAPARRTRWNWTGFQGKTIWDWLSILALPLSLAALAVVVAVLGNWHLQSLARVDELNAQTEREIADRTVREETLRAYFNMMSNLTLNNGLRQSAPGSEVRLNAHARTLSTLRQVDRDRKAAVVRFLYESSLIDASNTIVDLAKADLRGINLSGVDLRFASLPETDLRNANLKEADLRGNNLRSVDLRGVDLRTTNLRGANLVGANLNAANLEGATLIDTNLRGASPTGANLSGSNLRGANLSESNFTAANLSAARLPFANLRLANLTDAELAGADLSQADFSGAVVTPEQLAKAASLRGAKMPDGRIHE